MSEQAIILQEMEDLVMSIITTGSPTEEHGSKISDLEFLLFEQKCFKDIEGKEHSCLGEEIANLFFTDKYIAAIKKMSEYEITPEDFFGFAEYHYDEEPLADMFTEIFIADVNKAYQAKD